MSDGIDAQVNAVQTATRHPVSDPVPGQAGCEQMLAGEDAVAAGGPPGDHAIDRLEVTQLLRPGGVVTWGRYHRHEVTRASAVAGCVT